MAKSKLRVVVIGCGAIAQRRHLPEYAGRSDVEVVAVVDIKRDRAKEIAAQHGVKKFFTDYRKALAMKPDLVSVATGGYEYGSDHHRPTMQALAAGCHVLCEKPLSNDVAEAREMVAEARRRKLCLGTNLNHRFTPLTAKAKQWVDEGRLGTLLFINMSMWIANPAESSPYFHLRLRSPKKDDLDAAVEEIR
jgi:predicted dehydrogenase